MFKPKKLHNDKRGQVLQDFVLGIGIFLITVAFVGLFIPNMFAPFAVTDSGDSIKVERMSDTLIHNYLQDTQSDRDKTTLDKEATIAFFALSDETNNNVNDDWYDELRYDQNDDIEEVLGAQEFDDVQVEITNPDGTTASLQYYTEVNGNTEDITLSTGEIDTERGITTIDRIVYIDGSPYRMTIRLR